MNMVLEYYLTGGKLKIGKKEAALELLRKNSVLRQLLGYTAGELNSFVSHSMQKDTSEDFVTFDFTGIAERKLSGDPTQMLNELKQRYGEAVGGKLYFRMVYTTFMHVFYSQADLDADEISLTSTN
jgi:hypothetical protein